MIDWLMEQIIDKLVSDEDIHLFTQGNDEIVIVDKETTEMHIIKIVPAQAFRTNKTFGEDTDSK